jgi:hypothetical protein
MFKKGVDGRQMWNTLCPSASIGITPEVAAPAVDAAASSLNIGIPSQLTSVLPGALNCTGFFENVLNGFTGNQLTGHVPSSISHCMSSFVVAATATVWRLLDGLAAASCVLHLSVWMKE